MLLQALHVHNCLPSPWATWEGWHPLVGVEFWPWGLGWLWMDLMLLGGAQLWGHLQKRDHWGPTLSLSFVIAGVYSPFAGHSLTSSVPSVLIPTHWEMLRAAGGDSSSWEELFPAGVTDWEVWGSSLAAQDFFCPRFSSSYVQCSSSSKSHHGRASVCRSLFLGFNMGHFSQYLSSLGAQGHINSNLLVVVVVVLDQAIINSLSSYRCQIWQGFSLLVSLPWVWFYYMLLYLNLEGRKLITAWT